MNPFNYYVSVLKNFAKFDGRARRAEYWYFVLFNIIISIVTGIIDGIIGMPIVGGIYSLAVIVPSIAVAIRRMHDVGKSGWFILIPFYNLYLAVTEGEKGPNQYGADPKGAGGDLALDDTLDGHLTE